MTGNRSPSVEPRTRYDWMTRFHWFADCYYPYSRGWDGVTVWKTKIGFGAYQVRLIRYGKYTDHFIMFPDDKCTLVRRVLWVEDTPPEDNGIWLEFEHWKTGTTRLSDRLRAYHRTRDRVGSV